ncbi:rhodanese-like domain-containing protein [Brachybacterium alimentarium]|uniref:rhodanese-like domain-containing protein n=1 Tax=Brachybacterium alimentarium TaxID=47845 RepID=UPI000DF18D22|nr:rhodanese-like domain-containing protein [Brachybacterium alimentarium]RCS69359.1 rhodanese-like domain-containing protein [Brachybacterium alimentarium]
MELENVTPSEVPEGAHLIDVREPNEWDAGHAPTAQHIPASSLMENLDKLPEDDEALYIVCRGGGRSFQVAQWLNVNGFEAINVAGGMDIWFESGLPIESDGEDDAYIL